MHCSRCLAVAWTDDIHPQHGPLQQALVSEMDDTCRQTEVSSVALSQLHSLSSLDGA